MVLAAFALTANAEGTSTGIIVKKTDGSCVSIPLSQLRSIKFSETEMLVNKTDNTQLTIEVSDIVSMDFEDIVSAIKTIMGDNADENLSVVDPSGRVIYNGAAGKFSSDACTPGVYVIKTDKNTYKVKIGGK